MTNFKSLQEIEAFFAAIPYKKRDFPPFSMLNQALELLENPQQTLTYIHITGTNGKGSTANYLSHFLVHSGLRVGLFTSPHIFAITERIQVNNQPISATEFMHHFNRIYQLLYGHCKLIQFEWLYLVALDYYMTKNLDIVILEVGIGGAYDTTNTIPHKLAAIITNISYDHRTLLGNSLQGITEQKRAIITDTTDFAFVGNITNNQLLAAIDEQLDKTHTPGYFLFRDFWFDVDQHLFCFFCKEIRSSNKDLPPYQYENITLALAAADKILWHFQKVLDLAKAKATIDSLQMPIRFEVIKNGNNRIVFDGAHNLAGLDMMLQALHKRFPHAQYIFVYAAMVDKDYREMLNIIAANGEVFLYDFHPVYARAFEPTDSLAFPIIRNENELKALMASAKNDVVIYVGSIYFVSYIRNLFQHGLMP